MLKLGKINKYISLLFIIGILISVSVHCQDNNIDLNYSAKLEELSTHDPISYAHIINLRTHIGVISNSEGLFSIPVNIGDTLRIGGISYHEVFFKLTDSIIFNIDTTVIPMVHKIYEIDEVEVVGLTWRSLRHKIKTIKIPEKRDILSQKPLQLFNKEQIQANIANSTSVGIPFQLKSKQNKSREKVNELFRVDEIKRKVRNKLIELTDTFAEMDDKEMNSFIRFCRISSLFIQKSNDYDLLVLLKKKYIEFKKK